jgi:hypothetical protein
MELPSLSRHTAILQTGHMHVNCAREYFAADVPEPPVSDGAEGLPR